jgi:hypothetical protein
MMRRMSVKRAIAARKELTKLGVLVDSGTKLLNPKTGKWEIAWIINPDLSQEQLEALALAEMPKTTRN